MSFPTISVSKLGLSPSEAAKLKKREAAKSRKAAWDAEVAELRTRKAERDKEAVEQSELPVDGEAGYLIGLLRSPAFAEIYQDLAGKDVSEWLRPVLNISDYMLKLMGTTRVEWIREHATKLIIKYCQQDPEYKTFLDGKIIRTRDHAEKRRLRIRIATPFWANPLRIAAIYRERDRMTAETGVEHEVDHIVPLVHPRVCGLHCEANLRVVSAQENREKSNLFHI